MKNKNFPFHRTSIHYQYDPSILTTRAIIIAIIKETYSPLAAPSSAKCHRKETWERIRRRPSKLNSRNDKHSQDVWIKRESVHTQTKENDDQYSQDAVDSSSGLDDTLPRIKPPRPTNLPLCEFH